MPTKQDIISQVTSAAMHILHDSYLYGSTLWPKRGFVIGALREDFIHDIIYVIARVRLNQRTLENDQSLSLILHSLNYKRIKKQAQTLDLILDYAVHSNVSFNMYDYPELDLETRYWGGCIGNSQSHYIQLHYSFTIID